MTKPAAKEGDRVMGLDVHVIMIPAPGGPVPTPTPMPFDGVLVDDLAGSVNVDDARAAMAGSGARNVPPHVPSGGPFQRPPKNEATIQAGSSTVTIEDRAAARLGDPAMTCNDPTDAPTGTVVSSGTVFIGG
jgi:uncharacterized Zn-binding protein involved in type VI secretion